MTQEQQQATTAVDPNTVPEAVKAYLLDFQASLYNENRSLDDLANLYENQFYKICEKHYKEAPWHTADVVAPLVGNGAKNHNHTNIFF